MKVIGTGLVMFNLIMAQVAGPDEMIKGMHFVRSSSEQPYNSAVAESALIDLKSLTRINWVVIVPVWFISDTGGSDICFRPDSSPTDSEIVWIINRAHRLGLKVFLKPEVRCLSGVGQGYHNPRDTNWFAQYRGFITRYADIALRTGCELFSVGAGLDRSTDEPWEVAEWEKTIKKVRGMLSSGPVACPITYAADWRTYCNIPFWNLLDYIGINAYFPLWDSAGSGPSSPPSVDYLSDCWKMHLARMESLAVVLGQKPVLFTEVGYPSVRGGSRHPGAITISGGYDYDEVEQRNGYLATFHSLLGKPWFAGWFWFNWVTDTTRKGALDLSYSPKGKPAQEVLRRFNASIGSHKGFCLTGVLDSVYFWPRTYQALDSLKQHHANWVAVNARWIMADTGIGYDTIKPIPGHSPDSGSIRVVIDSAHRRGLSVALSCYLAVTKGWWCGLHNPGLDTNWFRDESVYLSHCARIAEQESVEMLTVGLEINQTMDSYLEAELWRRMILPAVRQIYSGPLCYGASSSPYVHPLFWDGVDFCGYHPYVALCRGLFSGSYPEDTAISQRPNPFDLLKNEEQLGWQDQVIPELYANWYQVNKKPILFTEIGYRSLDSTAAHPAYDFWYGYTRVPARGDTVITVTRRNLRSVCFPVDTMTGYVVGDSGTIIKTTDSGDEWRCYASGTHKDLYAVDFPTRDSGYAVGAGGVILKTNNGFSGCENVSVPGLLMDYYSVCFPKNTLTGYVVGDSGTILKTTDGGRNWQRVFASLGSETLRVRLRSVAFPRGAQSPAAVGYIVGDSGTILKTTNAGDSWYRLPGPVNVNLNGVDFISPEVGFVVGDRGTLLKTTDGGEQWELFFFRTREWDFNSVAVPDYDSARFIVGTKGIILRAGDAWEFNGSAQVSNIRQNLHDIQFHIAHRDGYYDLVGFAVGDSGTILRAFSGGRMRVDFNEQANCYEAAFLAFWGDKARPSPLPWFYGFHFYKWLTDPVPMDIEHEIQIDDYTPQQKRAGEIVREWFRVKN
ncbi:MAG: glycoside hydrolase family 113 [bacterium]